VALLLVVSSLAARPARAQKSLSDGVDELATKLAKSYGEGKRGKVAIVPLRELGGGENLLGTYIAETLTSSFFDAGYRDIVERQMLDRALQELKLSLTGMIDADSAKKIGKFLHADLVVGGTMTDLAGEVSVNCRMFAVETGQVVAVATTKMVKDENVNKMWAAAAGGGKGVGSPDTSFPKARPEAAPLATFDAASYRLVINSVVKRGNTATVNLLFEATESEMIYLSYGSCCFSDRLLYLIDENGERWELDPSDTEAGKYQSCYEPLKLLPGTKLSGRLRFIAKENASGSHFTLSMRQCHPRELLIIIHDLVASDRLPKASREIQRHP
jgi:TolB-like protein